MLEKSVSPGEVFLFAASTWWISAKERSAVQQAVSKLEDKVRGLTFSWAASVLGARSALEAEASRVGEGAWTSFEPERFQRVLDDVPEDLPRRAQRC